MSEPIKMVAIGTQCLVAIAGCVLFWRHIASRSARSRRPAPRLPTWNVTPTDVLFFLLLVLGGGFFGSAIAGLLGKSWGLAADNLTIFATTGSHLGMLGGVGLFSRLVPGGLAFSIAESPGIFSSGLVTFLIAMPIVFATGIIWAGVLQLAGLPVERQLAVEIFARMKAGPWLVLMGTTAVLLAPATEELVFRAGLFRFMRTRLPRWAALLLPASLFAAMHVDLTSYAQLVVLGIVFSIAYERTGRIGTAIVAHAFFNLSMLFLLLAGVTN